jgi:hypothetical protein
MAAQLDTKAEQLERILQNCPDDLLELRASSKRRLGGSAKGSDDAISSARAGSPYKPTRRATWRSL